jgi:hypothetical protein
MRRDIAQVIAWWVRFYTKWGIVSIPQGIRMEVRPARRAKSLSAFCENHGDVYWSRVFPVVGTGNTSSIPAECVRYWWLSNGSTAYAEAETVLITADHDPGIQHDARGWKKGLQRFVDETGLSIKVLYFPPGMRKWEGIEDRLVFHIHRERHESPCADFEVIVNVIHPQQ